MYTTMERIDGEPSHSHVWTFYMTPKTNRHEKKLGSGELRLAIDPDSPQFWELIQIRIETPPSWAAELGIRDFLRLHWCCLAFFFQKQVALSELFLLEKFHQLSHKKSVTKGGLGYSYKML